MNAVTDRSTSSDFLPNYKRVLPAKLFRVPIEKCKAFRERHNLKFADVDRLLGFTSKGKAARLWEENGAPPYVDVLMAYIDQYGTELADKMAKARDEWHTAAFNEGVRSNKKVDEPEAVE